jgi:hypothetical protein
VTEGERLARVLVEAKEVARRERAASDLLAA